MDKVLVGISGGVDSSVTALLLRQQGFAVEGILFKQVNEEPDCDDAVCCAETAIARARNVCDQLDIPLHIPDVRSLFHQKVIAPSIDAWTRGGVPSPCTTCNSDVRAPLLSYYSKVLECDYFATGHYFINNAGQIFRGRDPLKDQSYMVSLVDRKLLERWKTPLGGYLKSEVRALAAEFSIPTAMTPDSQNLCFNHLLPSFERDVFKKSDSGLIQIGKHNGRPAIGQRKGFGGLTVNSVDSTRIVVDAAPPRVNRFNVSWRVFPEVFEGLSCQIAYHGKKYTVLDIDKASIELADMVTPSIGQVAAVYSGEQLLGGGTITNF